ncbi:MAG: DNA-formamidopyrimidine glycosylase family protein [Anaeromyxobacteraceae bacterium]
MPEGDTLLRTARTLHRALAGREVTRFETVLAPLARADADAPVAGRTVERVEAVGKHLLVRFSGGLVLRTHLRMHGTWHVYPAGAPWRRPRAFMRVAVHTAEAVAVGFAIPVAELVPASALPRGPLGALGPDLLAPDFDAGEATRRLRLEPARAIEEALLDQRAVAGIGNVFKSEVLFVAGIHPRRAVADVTAPELERILAVARKQLAVNAAPGHRGPRNTTGSLRPGGALWVYGRAGEPCRRCGAPIALTRRGPDARLTYHCPRCQAGP